MTTRYKFRKLDVTDRCITRQLPRSFCDFIDSNQLRRHMSKEEEFIQRRNDVDSDAMGGEDQLDSKVMGDADVSDARVMGDEDEGESQP